MTVPPQEGRPPKRMQLTVAQGEFARTGDGIAFVNGEIGPEVSAMEGNERFGMALDHASSRYVYWSVWTDPQSLAVNAERATQMAGDVIKHLPSHDPVTETFDLVYTHSAKPVHVGNWGNLTRVQIPIAELDRAVRFFTAIVVAWFENQTGPIDIIMGVDTATGDCRSLICYDTLRDLRDNEPSTQELQGVLATTIPGAKITEISELQVVIAETTPAEQEFHDGNQR